MSRDPFRPRRDVVLVVRAMAPCPVCEAEPGASCVCRKIKSKLFGKPIATVHFMRITAWHELGMPVPLGAKKLVDVNP